VTGEKSEWGKMSRSQPYVLLATDLLRAFLSLGLGEIEGRILAHVMENSWGRSAKRGRKGEPWPDPIPCRIDVVSLARTLGVPTPRISEAKSKLVKSGIIVEVEAGYLINKNADTWVKPGTRQPRLSPGSLLYAAAAHAHLRPIKSELADTLNRNENDNRSELADTVDRNENDNRSELADTVDRNRSELADTVDRNRSELADTVDRNRSELADTVDRTVSFDPGYRNGGAHACGNPTGSNTKLSEGNSSKPETAAADSRSARKQAHQSATPKQRGLALATADDEPFISPPDALPLPVPRPSEPDDPDTARLIASLKALVIEASTTPLMPDGNGEMAEVLADQVRKWRKLRYSADDIDKFSRKAIRTVRSLDQRSLIAYVVGCLTTSVHAIPEPPAKPVAKSSPPPGGYHVGRPRPGDPDFKPRVN
jgi:hypothetical protein